MKILYHHRIASKDGQFVHVEELTNAFIEQNHELLMIAPEISEKNDFGYDGGFVTKLKSILPKWVYESLEFTYCFWIFLKLFVGVLRFKPDFIYERYNLLQPAGVWVSKITGIPLFLEINAPLVFERSKYSGLALKKFAKYVENYTWRGATKCFPVSNVLADYLREEGVEENKIFVLHNGVRQQFIDEMLALEMKEDKEGLVIGFTGFIHPWHGMDQAIRAIAGYTEQNIRLVCVGDGDILPELIELAKELNVSDKIQFFGHLPRKEVLEVVKQFDIALQPAVTDYASPLKMFEYMAVGSLIVAPDSKNIREILDDETAVFFEKDNQDDFIEKLKKAITSFNEYKNQKEKVKKSVIDKGFVWQENAKKIVNLSKKL
jgi:glycosyltransferase involved in cell wall biosynthesis